MTNAVRARRKRAAVVLSALAMTCSAERRALGVTASWKSAVSDTWTDSAAWTGGLPINSGDYASISASGSPYTVNLGQSLNLGSGSVTLNSTAATLNIASGSVLSAYYVTIDSGAIGGTVQANSLSFNDTGAGSGGLFLFNGPSGSVSGSATSGDSLQIGPSSVSASTSVTFYSSSINANVHLVSTRGSANSVILNVSNPLTSYASFIVDADSGDPLASDNTRTISGSLTNSNTGWMQFNTSTTVSGTLSNQGTMNVASGATVKALSFVQQVGQLNVAGVLVPSTMTVNGGTISGTVQTGNLTLNDTGTGSGGLFLFNSSSDSLYGAGGSGDTVQVSPSSAVSSVYVTLNNSKANANLHLISSRGSANTITLNVGSLTSNANFIVDADPGDLLAADNVRSITGSLTNSNTGWMQFNTSTSVSSTLTNQGTMNIASGVTVTTPTFVQQSGQLNVAGKLSASSITVNGGTIAGTLPVSSLTLNDSGQGSGGSFLFNTSSGSYYGSGGSGDTVQISPSANASSVSVTFNPGSVNAGVHLISTRGSANTISLSLYNPLTSNGNFIVDGDAGDPLASDNTRSISGSLTNSATGWMQFNTSASVTGYGSMLTNQGTMNIAGGATVTTPSFTQKSGQLNVAGSLVATAMTVSGGTISGTVMTSSLTLNDTGAGSGGVFLFNASSGSVSGAGTSGDTLQISPSTANASVFVNFSGSTTNANIHLISSRGSANTITLSAGSALTSNGHFVVDADPNDLLASDNTRSISGSLTNSATGWMQFNTSTSMSGTLTNQGTMNVAGGATLTASTFVQQSGLLNLTGNLVATSMTVNGGTISGTVETNSLTLNDTGTGSGGLFVFNGSSGSLSGTGASGDTLQFSPSAGTSSVSASVYPSSINASVHLFSTRGSANSISLNPYVTLTSNGNFIVDGDAGDARVSDNVRSINGSLTNSITGTMQFNTSASVSGSLTNQGTMGVATGATVTTNSFIQQTGQLNLNGNISSSYVTYSGGMINGTGAIFSSSVSFPNLNAASGTFAFNQSSNTVSGAGIPAGVTLLTQPTASMYQTLYVPTPNNGTITLTSSAGAFTSVTLSCTASNGLINNGTINVSPDPSDAGLAQNLRTNSNAIVNYGSMNVAQGVALGGGTLNQAGGTLTVNGTLGGSAGGTFIFTGGTITGSGVIDCSTLSLAPNATASATGVTALLDGSSFGGSLSGTVPTGMSVLVQADSADNGAVYAGASGVNNGTLRLSSTFGANNSDSVIVSPSFTNQGLFSIDADSVAGVKNTRTISGTLINSGLVAVNTSATFGAATGGAAALVTNTGTFNIGSGATATVTAFNQTGGTLNIPAGASFNVSTLTLTGGQIVANGTVTVATLNYAGGNISGSSTVSPSTLNFQTSSPVSIGFVLNSATATVGGSVIPTGASVTVAPSAANPSINLYLPTVNDGTLNLTSTAGKVNQILIEPNQNYSLTNYGLISVSPDPNVAGATNNSRGMTGPLINQGAVNVASGAQLTVGTFNQVAGVLTVNGTLAGSTLYFNGGTVTGTGTIEYSNVTFAAPTAVSGVTVLQVDSYSQFVGDIPSGMNLVIQAGANASTTLIAGAGETGTINNGTIHLSSTAGKTNSVSLTVSTLTNQGLITIDPDPVSTVTNTRTLAGTFINAPAAEIDFNTAAVASSYYFGGAGIINYGTVNSGVNGSASGTLFNQAGGTLNVQGVFNAGALILTGGTVTGSGVLSTSNLSIGSAFTGGGTVEMISQTPTLSGPSGWSVPAGTSVDFYESPSFPYGCNASTGTPFTNNGTIRLSSATGTTNSVTLSLNGTLTNDGLFSVDADASASASQTSRSINGTLINNAPGTLAFNTNTNNPYGVYPSFNVANYGICNIANGAQANVTSFNQAGGTLNVNGILSCGTFEFSGGVVNGSANIHPQLLVIDSTVQAGTVFTNGFEAATSGTVPAGMNLIFIPGGSPNFGLPALPSTSLINDGRIDLSRNGSTATVDLPASTLTNAGLLVVDANTTEESYALNSLVNTATATYEIDGFAWLPNQVTNYGTITVASGATAVGDLQFLQQSGDLNVDGAFNGNLTLNGGSITGAGVIKSSGITVGTGSHDLPVTLVFSSGQLSLNGNLNLDGSFSINPGNRVTKTGAGTLNINGPQSHGSGTALNCSAGTVVFQTDPGANLTLMASNSIVELASGNGSGITVRNLAAMNLGSGGLVVLGTSQSESQRMVLITGGLNFTGSLGNWQGQLDLAGNDLIIHNGNLINLSDQLASGLGGGTWQGSAGILSSAAAGDSTHLTALGMMSNSNAGGGAIVSTFDGQNVVASDVLIKYTYYGDADLDGQVDSADYTFIDAGYLSSGSLTGWYNGDFNYDGVINGSDYTLIDNAFNQQGAQLASQVAGPSVHIATEIAGSSAVPEPAGLALVGIAALGLVRRRR